ncbi:MAG: hypothetical protein PUP91_17905 [Rhizonema sp. PD37]|nr:hypothetical protein [Rhizonema sp. PD37]
MSRKPANADVTDLSCPVGNEEVLYSPAITNTPRQATAKIDNQYTTCVSTKDLTITSAEGTFTIQGPISCNALGGLEYDIKYTFNNGKFSKVHYVGSNTVQRDGQTIVTATGSVSDGLFKGDMVTRTVTDVNLNINDCNAQGIHSISGPSELLFVGR